MFLCYKIAEQLIIDGFSVKTETDGYSYSKKIINAEQAGSLSDGSRIVTLTIDISGRWFARVDGWGKVEKDCDLRQYDDAKKAIDFLLFA